MRWVMLALALWLLVAVGLAGKGASRIAVVVTCVLLVAAVVVAIYEGRSQ